MSIHQGVEGAKLSETRRCDVPAGFRFSSRRGRLKWITTALTNFIGRYRVRSCRCCTSAIASYLVFSAPQRHLFFCNIFLLVMILAGACCSRHGARPVSTVIAVYRHQKMYFRRDAACRVSQGKDTGKNTNCPKPSLILNCMFPIFFDFCWRHGARPVSTVIAVYRRKKCISVETRRAACHKGQTLERIQIIQNHY